MPIQFSDTLAGVCVPDTNHLVISSTDNGASIIRDLNAGQTALVAGEGANELLFADAPHLDSGIARGGDDIVVLDGDSIDWCGMTNEFVLEGEGLAVIDSDGGVLAASDDMVLVESNIENSALVVRKSLKWDIVWERPDDARVIARPSNQDLGIELEAQNRHFVATNMVGILSLV
jgi:hypothetical protein